MPRYASHSDTLMKRSLPILAGLLAIAAPLGAQSIKIDIDPNKASEPAKATTPPAIASAPAQKDDELIVPADGKYTDEQKIEVYGFLLAQKLNLSPQVMPLIRSEEEVYAFLRGFGAALTRTALRYDGNLIVPQTQELIESRSKEVAAAIEKERVELNTRNQAEEKEFLAKLDTQAGVKKTASGLRYELVAEGKGAKATANKAVRAHMKTTLIDGTVIVDPKDKDGKVVPVEVALETAIPGLKEGLLLTGVGGKLKLYVPAALAYGDQGMAPGALTIFEIEILEVKEPAKQPEAKK